MAPMKRFLAIGALLLSTACSHHRIAPRVSLNPLSASPHTVDSLWTAALDYYAHHKWDKSAATLDRVMLEMSPGDRRTLQGRLLLGDLYVREGSNLQAVREYRRLVDEYPSDSLAAEALLKAADAYKGLWRRSELDPTYGITAQSVYSEVLSRYASSPAAAKARAQIADLDNQFAIKEYKNANFYLKYKAYDSAILYLKDLAANYPRAAIVPTALADLIGAYRKLGYLEDVRDQCTNMARDWSATPQFRKACPATATAAVTTVEKAKAP